jgi:hypothetical protein
MIYKTKTREFGSVIFYAPAATDDYAGYVWIDAEKGYRSNERRQICYGGFFLGNTVSATQGTLKQNAQAWLRQRRAWHRREGVTYG